MEGGVLCTRICRGHGRRAHVAQAPQYRGHGEEGDGAGGADGEGPEVGRSLAG